LLALVSAAASTKVTPELLPVLLDEHAKNHAAAVATKVKVEALVAKVRM
jgi:hypothetical protein